MDFLKAPNPVDFLSKANEVCVWKDSLSLSCPVEGRLEFKFKSKFLSLCQITLGDGELENHSSTTEELRQCCRDIRVLGRKELRCWGTLGQPHPSAGPAGCA